MGLTRPQPRQIRRSLLLLSTSGLLLTLSKCKNGRALSYLRNSHDDKSDFRLELRKRVYCLRGGDEFEDLLDARAVVNPYSSNPSSSNEDLQDLECYKPVNNVDITTIGMVKVSSMPQHGMDYEELPSGLRQYRGPIRLNEKFMSKGHLAESDLVVPKADEDYEEKVTHNYTREVTLLQGDELAHTKPRWGHEKSETDYELFKHLKYPSVLTQDRIWFEAPRMQMLELRNGSWTDAGLGTLRLHSTVHWEHDKRIQTDSPVRLKTTRWIEMRGNPARPPIFTARLTASTMRYDPTPIRSSVRLNIFDVTRTRVRVLAFRQLPRSYLEIVQPNPLNMSEEEAQWLKDGGPEKLKWNETHGYHDISPTRTAVRLLDEIPHFVPLASQIPQEIDGDIPEVIRPMIIHKSHHWHLWRFREKEWSDYGIGSVEVFRRYQRSALRFLAKSTKRQLLSMSLGRNAYFIDSPVQRGVLIHGPALDATGNLSQWTILLRKIPPPSPLLGTPPPHSTPKSTPPLDGEEEGGTSEAEEDERGEFSESLEGGMFEIEEIELDFGRKGRGYLEGRGVGGESERERCEEVVNGALEVPSYRGELERAISDMGGIGEGIDRQLEATRVLLYSIQMSRCNRYPNVSSLLDSNFTQFKKRPVKVKNETLLFGAPVGYFGGNETSSGSIGSTITSSSDEDKQILDKRRTIYADFGGKVPGDHIYGRQKDYDLEEVYRLDTCTEDEPVEVRD
ncbi:hypothetical protein AAMO2058_000077300 [Amorphochlora amoebiformis]